MKNNTKQTIKQMVLAASVALTMGVASATVLPSVPGMPSGTDFEFNGSDTSTTSSGALAITRIGQILSAVNTEGNGSDIQLDKFWNSFISDDKIQVFHYLQAKDSIDELIYLVDGAVSFDSSNGAGSYVSTGSVFHSIAEGGQGGTVTIEEFATAKGWDTAGKRLKLTGDNAMQLLATLGFTTPTTADLGAVTYDSDNNASMDLDVMSITKPTSTSLVSNIVLGKTTVSQAGDNGASFKAEVTGASLNVANFTRANQLIDLIAAQLKNGYILDTANATKAVENVIVQHNAFLGASIVEQAKGLKGVIKNIGYQIAASALGKTAGAACATNDSACTTVGIKFASISSQITSTDNGAALAAQYVDALNAIGGFADNLIAFNATSLAGGYSGSTAKNDIDGTFGTISVRESADSNSVYQQMVAGNGTSPFGYDEWSTPLLVTQAMVDADGSLTVGQPIADQDGLVDFDSTFELNIDVFDVDGNITSTVDTNAGTLF